MDIQKQKNLYLAKLLEQEVIKQDEFEDLVFKPEINAFHSNYLSSRFMDNINFGWSAWQAATAQAVPEGFVLVPRIITDEWMAAYIDPAVNDYCNDFKDLPFHVKESELPQVKEDHQKPIRHAHKQLMRVIEAKEQSHV